MEKKRDSGLEMLRVLSMLCICFYHCIQHMGNNNWEIFKRPISANWVANLVLGSWGQVGVSVFVIISAWFLTEQKEIHIKKFFFVAGQAWIGSILIMIFASIGRLEIVSGKTVIKELLTPFYAQYWFVTVYLVFYMMIPILRMILKHISQKQLRAICIVGSLICPLYTSIFGTNEIMGGCLMDFCYLFFLTAYLKQKKENWVEKHCLGGSIASITIIIISGICIKFFLDTQNLSPIMRLIFNRNCFTYLLAFELVYLFKKLKFPDLRIINQLAKGVFGIYIFHENILMRGGDEGKSLLWEKLWHLSDWYDYSGWYILYLIGAVLITFGLCWIVSMMCQFLIEKILKINLVNNVCLKIESIYLK